MLDDSNGVVSDISDGVMLDDGDTVISGCNRVCSGSEVVSSDLLG